MTAGFVLGVGVAAGRSGSTSRRASIADGTTTIATTIETATAITAPARLSTIVRRGRRGLVLGVRDLGSPVPAIRGCGGGVRVATDPGPRGSVLGDLPPRHEQVGEGLLRDVLGSLSVVKEEVRRTDHRRELVAEQPRV